MIKHALAALAALLVATPAFAQAPTQPGYLVVVGKTLDREKMGQYGRALAPIYQKIGGHYVGVGGPGRGVTCVAGPCAGRGAVVARFDRADGPDAFWWGEDYRQAIRIRDRAGVFTVLSVTGEGARPFEGPDTGLLVLLRFAPGPQGEAFAKAAAAAGGRVAIQADEAAITPLEGDAFVSGLTVVSFETKAARDAFVAGKAVKTLKAKAPGAVLLAIDAPPPPRT